jgi:hypothetical protein
MAAKKTKVRLKHKKIGGKHFVTTKEIIEVPSFILELAEVTKLNLGFITSGLKSVGLRIRIMIQGEALKVVAKGGPASQEIWVYSKKIKKTARQLQSKFLIY